MLVSGIMSVTSGQDASMTDRKDLGSCISALPQQFPWRLPSVGGIPLRFRRVGGTPPAMATDSEGHHSVMPHNSTECRRYPPAEATMGVPSLLYTIDRDGNRVGFKAPPPGVHLLPAHLSTCSTATSVGTPSSVGNCDEGHPPAANDDEHGGRNPPARPAAIDDEQSRRNPPAK